MDSGPGKRAWFCAFLCVNQPADYTGAPAGMMGRALREGLRAAYEQARAVWFTDLDGGQYLVHVDDYEEQVRSPRTGLVGVSYHVALALAEA